MKIIPCRLFFLLARASATGVIFRRGPSRWVQIIRWDTRSDQFEPGQWFHGHIYERRCDLSPSGRFLVYFASNQSEEQRKSDYTTSWTAVSKPPWLTALALWPKGDCWAGGGAFADEDTLLLNHWEDVPHPKHNPRGRLTVKVHHLRGEDSPLFDYRLQRDGWILENRGRWHGWKKAEPPTTWSRRQPTGWRHVIRKLHGFFKQRRGITKTYDETFALRSGDLELLLPEVEWADWDQQGRLVFARGGQIVAANIADSGQITESVLADFNSAKPSPIAAPPSALRW